MSERDPEVYPDLRLGPCSTYDAKRWIGRVHRHNVPALMTLFSIGLFSGDRLVGVAMVGLPVSRIVMGDGTTLEVRRVAVLEGIKNANSMLYGACARAGTALGYRRIVTYTLEHESGISLRASGWVRDPRPAGDSDPRAWEGRPGRVGIFRDMFGQTFQRMPTGGKVKWTKDLQ